MDLQERMRLYEEKHPKEKLTLNESLFEEAINPILIFNAVKGEFGTSESPIDGPSFLLPDGTFIDMNKRTKYRDFAAHANAEEYLQDIGLSTSYVEKSGSPTLQDLGAIRLNTLNYNNFIELNDVSPTPAQYKALQIWLDENEQSHSEINVITPNFENSVTYNYDDYIVDEIISKIKRYYSSGRLYESLFEEAEDITELVRADTAAYKEMKKYRKNSKAYKEAFQKWYELHAQLTKKMYGGNVSFKVNESIEEADIPEEDPVIVDPVSDDHSVPEVNVTPEQNGVQNMLQFLIKDEWDAIEGYNNTIQTLGDCPEYEELRGVLQEISNEELVHVGQLQKALEFVNPVTAKIKEGETEATEQMTEPSTLPEEV